MLLELKDGGILNIESDLEFWSGCDTCDYGSRYINYFDVELTNKIIKVEVDQMYEYAMSEGQMMKIILSNVDSIKLMTENEFIKWLKIELEKEVDEDIKYVILKK